MSIRLPRQTAFIFLLVLLGLTMYISLASATSQTAEKRQTSSAPSFRFSVHTHSESAVKYSISPIYVTLFIGGASVLIAGLMI